MAGLPICTKLPGSSWYVSGSALAKSLHTEGWRTAASVRHRGAGGQDCSTGCDDRPQSDLRGGLPGLFVRVPARAQPASGAGYAECGAPPEASELGAGVADAGCVTAGVRGPGNG